MSVVGKPRKAVLGPRLAGTLMTPEQFDAVERYNENYRRTLTVCRPGEEDREVKEGETYQPPRLPGLELPLGRLLAAADAWDRRKTS